MAGLSSGAPTTSLLNRTLSAGPLRAYKYYAKIKSDYLQKPIPETAITGIWERLAESEGRIASVYFVAHGGKMSEIPETETPYPHRAGNLYFAAYIVFWEEGGVTESQRHISWNRRLYRFMGPYVSKSPRQAYMNYRDLDVGTNKNSGHTSFAQASIWGFKYFKNNFYRLARIKAIVDPTDFFQNEQSIPPLPL